MEVSLTVGARRRLHIIDGEKADKLPHSNLPILDLSTLLQDRKARAGLAVPVHCLDKSRWPESVS